MAGRNVTRGRLLVCTLTLVLLIFLCACPVLSNADAVKTLREDLETILRDPALDSAHVGVVIDSLTTGQRIFGYNAGKRFVPASNMKLFTTAAALLALSPDFRYETRLFTDGPVTSGVLHGDIIIEGSGDPTISGYFNGGDVLHVFRQWAKKLREMGVKEIRGDLVIDNSAFLGQPHGTGWDIDTTSCFSAPRDAFTFNNNCIQLDISPAARSGNGARMVMEPATEYVRLANGLTGRTDAGRDIINLEYTTPRTLSITGSTLPGNPMITRYVAVNHPAYFGGFVFNETLEAAGIVMKGEILCARNCPKTVNISERSNREDWKPVDTYRSPPLTEVIKVVNKLSNNLYAELLLLAVGRTTTGASRTDGSAASALAALQNAGIDTSAVTMVDGSGLSRHNLVTPDSVAQLLKTMARGPCASYFFDSLPVMSVDGTLSNRLKGSHGADRIRAKTGALTHVRSLSGYVTTRGGEILVFSILSNNHATRLAVDAVSDRIILKLLDHPSSEQ
jgi:D-alanyl-D-alanine carboxypeptidase/D-alanyl-D-alanine-endopeptidase (penicillin-binding protein 4)